MRDSFWTSCITIHSMCIQMYSVSLVNHFNLFLIYGNCDASFVPSAIRIFALSHEDESQVPAKQVRNECQNQKMAIPSETSLRFKSSNS